MYTARKAAQMAAFFARENGGRINILKLIKLLYLADREAMGRYGAPISFDSFVSMPHGPVTSRTLNLAHGDTNQANDIDAWTEWLQPVEQHNLTVQRIFKDNDLDELSEADVSVLRHIWRHFGHMAKWELVRYTHEFCGEWQDPGYTSIPINDKDIFRALGKTVAEADELAEQLAVERQLDDVFASL